MEYIVEIKNDIDFNGVPKALINNYKWTEGHTPNAFAQLIYVDGEGVDGKGNGFALHMEVEETNPTAVYTNYNDPVYKDSCLEFFVNFNNGDKYMNFEMNSNGAFLAAIRTDRKNKTPIHEVVALPAVKASKTAISWGLDVFFSNEFIGMLFGKDSFKSGDSFKGNFYKCGDETPIPHFGMWSPVDNETPDFHRPEFFGTFIIE